MISLTRGSDFDDTGWIIKFRNSLAPETVQQQHHANEPAAPPRVHLTVAGKGVVAKGTACCGTEETCTNPTGKFHRAPT